MSELSPTRPRLDPSSRRSYSRGRYRGEFRDDRERRDATGHQRPPCRPKRVPLAPLGAAPIKGEISHNCPSLGGSTDVWRVSEGVVMPIRSWPEGLVWSLTCC